MASPAELPTAFGAACSPLGGGSMPASRTPAVVSGFGHFLNGYLGNGSTGSSEESRQHAESGEKRGLGDWVAPAAVPVPWSAPAPPIGWKLGRTQIPATAVAGQAAGGTADASPPADGLAPSGASPSHAVPGLTAAREDPVAGMPAQNVAPPEAAAGGSPGSTGTTDRDASGDRPIGLPQTPPETTVSYPGNPTLPMQDSAAGARPAAAQERNAVPELAFTARWWFAGPAPRTGAAAAGATPDSGTAVPIPPPASGPAGVPKRESLPLPDATGAPAAIGTIPESVSGKRGAPREDVQAQSKTSSGSTPSGLRGARLAAPDEIPRTETDGAGTRDSGGSQSGQPEAGHATAVPAKPAGGNAFAATGNSAVFSGGPANDGSVQTPPSPPCAAAVSDTPPEAADRNAQPANAAAPAEAGAARPAGMEMSEPPAQPVSHDVALHLADGQSSVDIRMAERSGEIRVTVHTADRDLANSLRNDLPDLVGKLRQNGFQADAWRPAAAGQPDGGRRSGSDGSNSQQHSAGARKDGRQPPWQQQQKNQSRWTGEWNARLDPAQETEL